jgi:deoxyribose-phosphate aldolase
MNKGQLIETITSQVVKKLNESSFSNPSTGNSSKNSCPSAMAGKCCCSDGWDGVGNLGEIIQEGVDRLGISGVTLGSCPDPALARLIDHTLLRAFSTRDEILALCEQAKKYCFKSVCINPGWVADAARYLRGSGVKVCTVVGFPLGANVKRVKELETRIAIDDGANEIDMVLNIGAMKSKNYKVVSDDIRAVARACRRETISKLILETCYLTDEEVVKACEMAKAAGMKFVKTSTGFGKAGASTHHVRLMRQTVGDAMGVKASGGIGDHETALHMLAAGASRLGVSASIAIVECEDKSGKKQSY